MNERKKLTTAAFKRKSCPKWACYAAVNKSGLTYYFGWEPILGDDGWIPSPQEIKPGFLGVFDATDWEHSLIKRPVKPYTRQEVEVCDLVSVSLPTLYRMIKAGVVRKFIVSGNNVLRVDDPDSVREFLDMERQRS